MTHGGEKVINITENAIRNHPLQSFDYLIRKIGCKNLSPQESKKLETSILRCILILANYTTQNGESTSDAVLSLLDRYKDIEERKIIAACFVRLLSKPAIKFFTENSCRPKVIQLLDAQFSEDLYQYVKIDADWQSYKKIGRLEEVVKDHEKELNEAFQTLTSLERMNAHRQKLMKALNNKVGKILSRPFLPDGTLELLNEIYKCVSIYLDQRDGIDVVDARAKVDQEIENFFQRLSAEGVLSDQSILKQIGTKLLTLVEQDFANNKATKPAKIFVEKTDKRYPLHLIHQDIEMGFVIKNKGFGYAYEAKLLIVCDEVIKLSVEEEIEIGKFSPATTQVIKIPAVVIQSSQEFNIELEIDWRNFDGTQCTSSFSCTVKAQRSDIDWEPLKQSNPYSLNPVENEQELAGRREVLNRLIANSKSSGIGSSIIQGQKRVGKTSIAIALKTHLEKLGYLVAILEGGQYVEQSAGGTIKALGRKICKKIIGSENKVRHISIPTFDDALSPLDEFLDDISEIIPERQLVVILDEFDELPQELYIRSELGSSFFLTLRSLSSRTGLGFVLVGGEKMKYIMDCQGKHLNKWPVYSVDYFERESDMSDYRELVERPVNNILEYTETALNELHKVTAGNPFFTKLVCQYVFETAVDSRDCHVTEAEIEKAIEKSMSANETNQNTFAHFWEDGIFEIDEKSATEKSIRRRKILMALSDELAKQSPVSEKRLSDNILVKNIPSLKADLKEFDSRKVLINTNQDETYDFKVPLFHEWLKERGINEVIINIPNLETDWEERQQQEKLKVRSNEIVNLVKRWGPYKGLAIKEDKVRSWLEQFHEIREQRAMFTLLEKLRFYSNSFVRSKMTEIHEIVKRDLTRKLPEKNSKKLKQSDILVSYLDGVAKSGAEFARLYIDEASLYVGNLVEKKDLANTLLAKEETIALVFIDDLVATGSSAVTYLEKMESMTIQKRESNSEGDFEEVTIADIVLERDIKVIFVAIAAFIDGWKKVEGCAEKLRIPVQTHVCELLDETAQCFNDKSRIFTDLNQREIARKVAQDMGRKLEKNCPLGYGDLELAVVFERGIPNNSLPILWSESTKYKWIPLFKRN